MAEASRDEEDDDDESTTSSEYGYDADEQDELIRRINESMERQSNGRRATAPRSRQSRNGARPQRGAPDRAPTADRRPTGPRSPERRIGPATVGAGWT